MPASATSDIQDLIGEAQRALASRDLTGARTLLSEAVARRPADPGLRMRLAACERGLGDREAALRAVDGALALEPRHFPALLMKASLLEAMGQARRSAQAYGIALTQLPAGADLDPATSQAVRHAREACGRHRVELQDFLRQEIGAELSMARSPEARRLKAFTELMVGARRNYRQEPVDFFYPGLPAIEFYEREHFPWLADLEAQTPVIEQELRSALEQGAERFTPYIDYAEPVPLDQWAELNHSQQWSALHLIRSGVRQDENCALCPRTAAAVAELPQPKIPGRSPAAMFSQLQAGARIPPHTGVANVRLVMHLPLIVPPGCGFRVGGETREWRPGEGWVFDDTIEHEAWNGSRRPRVILICDVWSPLLSQAEREGVARLMSLVDQFNDAPPSADV